MTLITGKQLWKAHKGQTTITSKKGGVSCEQYCSIAAIPTDSEEQSLNHCMSITRQERIIPLKKKQSMIVISCKLMQIFYAILANGVTYDAQKMQSDILRQPAGSIKERL